MTFSLVAHCPRTGRFGAAFATRTIAVGARCVAFAPRFGVAVSQATVYSDLTRIGAQFLGLGYGAEETVERMAAADPHAEYRQIVVLTAAGAAARTGRENMAWAGHRILEGGLVMGNVLIGDGVVAAMASAFEAGAGLDLDERLLRTLEAGRDAGGQHGGQRSASLLIHGSSAVPDLDLRVDEHAEPVGELRRLHGLFRPLLPYYELQRSNPVGLPRYSDWLDAQGDRVKLNGAPRPAQPTEASRQPAIDARHRRNLLRGDGLG